MVKHANLSTGMMSLSCSGAVLSHYYPEYYGGSSSVDLETASSSYSGKWYNLCLPVKWDCLTAISPRMAHLRTGCPASLLWSWSESASSPDWWSKWEFHCWQRTWIDWSVFQAYLRCSYKGTPSHQSVKPEVWRLPGARTNWWEEKIPDIVIVNSTDSMAVAVGELKPFWTVQLEQSPISEGLFLWYQFRLTWINHLLSMLENQFNTSKIPPQANWQGCWIACSVKAVEQKQYRRPNWSEHIELPFSVVISAFPSLAYTYSRTVPINAVSTWIYFL